MLGRVCMDSVEGTAGVVGKVGLADGGHSEYDTWQTLGTVSKAGMVAMLVVTA